MSKRKRATLYMQTIRIGESNWTLYQWSSYLGIVIGDSIIGPVMELVMDPNNVWLQMPVYAVAVFKKKK